MPLPMHLQRVRVHRLPQTMLRPHTHTHTHTEHVWFLNVSAHSIRSPTSLPTFITIVHNYRRSTMSQSLRGLYPEAGATAIRESSPLWKELTKTRCRDSRSPTGQWLSGIPTSKSTWHSVAWAARNVICPVRCVQRFKATCWAVRTGALVVVILHTHVPLDIRALAYGCDGECTTR